MASFQYYSRRFTIKYLVFNNGLPYYQRRVPADLVDRIGTRLLKTPLKAKDGSPESQCEKLGLAHTRLFETLRADPATLLPDDQRAAQALLFEYGLRAGQGITPIPQWKNEGAEYSDIPHADEFLHYYNQRKAEGRLTPTDEAALKALQGGLPKLLSDVRDIYLDDPRQGKWRDTSTLYLNRLIELTGDIPLEVFGRDQALAYKKARADAGVKSGTIEKELGILRAAFTRAIRRLNLTLKVPNPFLDVGADNAGKDVTKRKVPTRQEMQAIYDAAKAQPDDIRTMVLLCFATGSRIGEVAALRREDVYLSNDVPYVQFEVYGDSTLKTKNSVRPVPLASFVKPFVASALDAAACQDSIALFPRYADGHSKAKATSASGAANKWIKKHADNVTSHCFRHAIKDYMKAAGITRDLRDEITGHAHQNIGDTYGDGFAMEQKLAALEKTFSFLSK